MIMINLMFTCSKSGCLVIGGRGFNNYKLANMIVVSECIIWVFGYTCLRLNIVSGRLF